MNLAGFFGWPTRLNGSGPRTSFACRAQGHLALPQSVVGARRSLRHASGRRSSGGLSRAGRNLPRGVLRSSGPGVLSRFRASRTRRGRLPRQSFPGESRSVAGFRRIAPRGVVPASESGARRNANSGGIARRHSAEAGSESALGTGGGGPGAPADRLVQSRIPGTAPDRLAHLGAGAGKAHPLRGGS